MQCACRVVRWRRLETNRGKKNHMGVAHTFLLIPQSRTTGALPPSRTRHWRKDLRPQAQPSRNAMAKTDFLPASEESVIVKRAIAGDAEALAVLFARERGRLFRTAF